MVTSLSLELDQVTFPWQPFPFAHRWNPQEFSFSGRRVNFNECCSGDMGQRSEHNLYPASIFRYNGSILYQGEELYALIHQDRIYHNWFGFVILSTEPIPKRVKKTIHTSPQSLFTMCLSTSCSNWKLLQNTISDQLPKKIIECIENHKKSHHNRIIQDTYTAHQAKLEQFE